MSGLRAALFAHRLTPAEPSGVHRYLHELVNALSLVLGSDDRYVVTSTPERAVPAPGPMEVSVLRWPRRLVHLCWCLDRGPHLERALGTLDVVHLLTPFPPARSRAPLVVTIHDLMPIRHPDWFSRSERWTYLRSVDLTARSAARVIVHSEFVAKQVVEMLAIDQSRVVVIPHGVTGVFAKKHAAQTQEAAARRWGVQPGRFAVYVGAVSTRKNLVPLVEAIGALAEPVPLLIIGSSGRGAVDVDLKIERIQPELVRRTGYLPDDEVAALVAGAAVLVHPALEEGFGLTPLEAMAAGTPVVAARVGAIPEVVGDAGTLVERPDDPESWATAMDQVIGDDSLRQKMIVAGRAIATNYTWERAAVSTMGTYQQVAKSHHV